MILQKKIIKSLNEYLNEIHSLLPPDKFKSSTLPWFRGQSDENWQLTPAIYRGKGNGFFEREMTRDFIMQSQNNSSHSNNLETLIDMQHYGIPTRLLDWTESSLYALYFAVRDFHSLNNGAVFILDPWELNLETLPTPAFNKNDKTVPTSFDLRLSCFLLDLKSTNRNPINKLTAELPIAFRPKRLNSRIRAQKGMFTIHGNSMESIDNIIVQLNKKSTRKIGLRKLIIDGKEKVNILKQLHASGITHSTFFPEQEGICKEISFRYSNNFTGSIVGHEFGGF